MWTMMADIYINRCVSEKLPHSAHACPHTHTHTHAHTQHIVSLYGIFNKKKVCWQWWSPEIFSEGGQPKYYRTLENNLLKTNT